MPDVPRDPRQLARDILAGKISIEELAREQQRRRAGGGGAGAAPLKPPPQIQQVPDRIPLPRQAPPPQRPVVRQPPPPPRQQQRPKAVPQQQVRRQQQARPAPPPAQPAQRPQAEVAVARGATESQTAANRAKPIAAEKQLGMKRLLRHRNALRQGILMSEILGRPIALRDE